MIAAAVQDLTETIPGLDSLTRGPSNTWKEIILIVGISLAVGLVCLVIFLVFRKKGGDIAAHRHSASGRSGSMFGGGKRRRHRERRERYEHRNPTRAEVGGFPELRDDPAPTPAAVTEARPPQA